MKNTKIFITAFLLMPIMLNAQYNRNVSYNTAGLGNPAVVRSWNDHLVTAYSTENGTVFSCSDFSPFFGAYSAGCISTRLLYSDPLSNVYINDMKIVDDMLFYCGYKYYSFYSWTGIVGYFKLNEFFLGMISPQNYEYSPNVFELKKMVAYKNGAGYKIVAIGYDNIIPTLYPYSDNSSILEIDDIINSPSVYNYYIIDRSIAPHEHIDDIVYTGGEVVFVGEINYASANHMPCIRVMDNLNSFNSSIGYNNLYSFNVNTIINGRVKAVATKKDEICIAYSHLTATEDYTTQIRLIDNLQGVPRNFNSQEFDNDYTELITDLTYLPNHEELVLLHPFTYTPLDDPKFIYLFPHMTSSYMANYTFFSNSDRYSSLDVYVDENIASVGGEKTYLQYVPSFINAGCPDLKLHKVAVIDNSPVTLFNSTPFRFSPVHNPFSPSLNVHTAQWNGDCCY